MIYSYPLTLDRRRRVLAAPAFFFLAKPECCVYQVTFFCMKCPVKGGALFQKDMLEKRCAVIESYWWRMEKLLVIGKIIVSRNVKYVKSLKKELNWNRQTSEGFERRKHIYKTI